MTTEQLEQKIDELIAKSAQGIKDKAVQLARSGAEDIDEYPNNFELPKLLFVAALQYQAEQYNNGMPEKEYKKRLKNLSHF